MGLDELRQLIADSDRGDWNIVSCFGKPSFLPWSPDGEFNEHLARAAYRPDLSIGLAWGITDNDNYREDWANDFPDEHAESELADILYNGMLVAREILVSVDGGRALLPIPYDHEKLLVRRWDYAFGGAAGRPVARAWRRRRSRRQEPFRVREVLPAGRPRG